MTDYSYGVIHDMDHGWKIPFGTRGIYCPICDEHFMYEEGDKPHIKGAEHLSEKHNVPFWSVIIRHGERLNAQDINKQKAMSVSRNGQVQRESEALSESGYDGGTTS